MLTGNQAGGDGVYSEPYVFGQVASVQSQPTSGRCGHGTDGQPMRNSQTRKARRKVTKNNIPRAHTDSNFEDVYYSEPRCASAGDMGNSESGSGSSGVLPVTSVAVRDVTHRDHDRDNISYDLSGSSGNTSPPVQEIQLGDYTEPPDRKTDSVGGIRRPKPEEYCDPYDMDKMLKEGKARHKKNDASALRHSAPTKQSQDDIYELAQSCHNTGEGNSSSKGNNSEYVNAKKVLLYRTQSEGACLTSDRVPNITGTSFDSGVETGIEAGFDTSEADDQDDYDHLTSWKCSNPSSPLTSPGYTQSPTLLVGEKSPKMDTISSAFSSVGASSGFPTGGATMTSPTQPTGQVEEVYASAYEEPWDSKQSQQHFSTIVEKAESSYTPADKNDDRIIPGVLYRQKPKPSQVAMYEDAWDTEERQKQMEKTVQEAQRKQSSSSNASPVHKGSIDASSAAYEDPWTDIKGLRSSGSSRSPTGQGQLRKPGTPSTSPAHRSHQALPVSTSPAHRPPQKLPGASRSAVAMDTESNVYELPWDTKKKGEELEEKVQKAGLKHGSPINHRTVVDTPPPLSPGSPPDFFPPPPSGSQMYEEAWDIKHPSQLLSKAQTEGASWGTGGQKRLSEGRERAEPIDPGLPLDIQKFYHGSVTRREAEELMRIHKEGSYLVRRSETQRNVFSLSMKGIRGMPMHIRIGLSNGEYILGENSQPFPTVPEVIDYYTRHELPVQNAGRLRLLYPIMREKQAN